MNPARARWLGVAGILAGLWLAACRHQGDAAPPPPPLFIPPDPPVPLSQVSDGSPFAAGCGREEVGGTVYRASEVEPWVSVNPLSPDNLAGTWQQDRWSNGGAQGVLAGVSYDGGLTWQSRQVPFSRCSGGNSVNGGDYARATDPWVSFGPDGTLYWMAMVITDFANGQEVSGMRVSRSVDGGDSWDAPVTLIEDLSPFFNDKNAITADPTDARYVYAVWDRLDLANDRGPAYLARSTDGGDSWEAARVLYDPGDDAQTVGNLVVVLPDGTVVNLFTEIHYGTPSVPDTAELRIVRSSDHGATWGPPVTVAELQAVGVQDPEGGKAIRAGGILGAIAAGPAGELYVAWEDARHGGGSVDGIVLSKSLDGGDSWSAPALVSLNGVPAFTPTLAVAADGALALAYYDLRDNTPEATLLTGYWLATSTDGGASWVERRVSGPFDLSIAPDALGLFLGDYQGLGVSGSELVPFFVQTAPDLGNRTNVYAVRLPWSPPVAPKALRRALPAPGHARTPDWARRTGELIRRERRSPELPGQLPAYLR